MNIDSNSDLIYFTTISKQHIQKNRHLAVERVKSCFNLI